MIPAVALVCRDELLAAVDGCENREVDARPAPHVQRWCARDFERDRQHASVFDLLDRTLLPDMTCAGTMGSTARTLAEHDRTPSEGEPVLRIASGHDYCCCLALIPWPLPLVIAAAAGPQFRLVSFS